MLCFVSILLTFGALVLNVVDARRGPERLWLRPPVLPAQHAALLLRGVLCRPAVKVLLEEAEPRAVGPRLRAGDGLVVVAVQAAVEDPLEGPAALGVAQPVELTLAHCKARWGQFRDIASGIVHTLWFITDTLNKAQPVRGI